MNSNSHARVAPPELRRFGNYEIIAEIGRGGMAVVYQAYDRAQRRVAALKVLPPYLAHDPDLVRRFVREGQECRALQHANIVHTYDAGEAGGVYYIAMEYLPGGSLAEALARQGHPFDVAVAVSIASQIASALDYAHQRGVLHRDVKLRNILLDGRGRAVLSDFGIAKVASHSTLTPARALLGTAYAMSPEQARGDGDLDRRSDVYALGVVLYELLTGQPPFRGEHDAVILHAILYDAPRPPRSLNPAILPTVERVILTALQKDRARRYATAGQLAAALAAAAPLPAASPADAPTRAATPVGRPAPPRRPLPSWIYAGAAGGIVLAVILVIWLMLMPPAPPGPVPAVPTTDRAAVTTGPPTPPPTMTSEPAGAAPSPVVTAAGTAEYGTAVFLDTAEAAIAADGWLPTAVGRADAQSTDAATGAPAAATAPPALPTATPLPAIQPGTASLLAPQLQAPGDGDTMVEQVVFRWISVATAAGYRVETRSDRPGQTEWQAWDRVMGESSTAFTLTFANNPYFTIPGTVYFWRVAALDGSGNAKYSQERRFVMQMAQPPTATPPPPPTAAPTAVPPQAPTAAPTEVPTQAPTAAPTEVPTQAPTPWPPITTPVP